ncbi:hypothetical protein [Arthrobacter rhombi]|uniref:hypothetical protein n=1 Tax=Arthrobacter rhombi TaxID=71253 RepID=UPI003FD1AD60
MAIQNVHQVSDPQSTVEAAMEQLGRMLDDTLADLAKLFEANGGTMWGVEAISHNVIAVPGEGKRTGPGLLGRTEPGPTSYVATAMMAVTHNNEALR